MQAAVDARLARVRAGNLGDHKGVGAGVSNCELMWAPGCESTTASTANSLSSYLVAATSPRNRATSTGRSNYGSSGCNLTNMRLKNYRDDLLERLKDEDYAAEYLARVLAENDKAAFLVALKDVVEATGGMSVMAKRAGLKRPLLQGVFQREATPPWKLSKPSWRRWACASQSPPPKPPRPGCGWAVIGQHPAVICRWPLPGTMDRRRGLNEVLELRVRLRAVNTTSRPGSASNAAPGFPPAHL